MFDCAEASPAPSPGSVAQVWGTDALELVDGLRGLSEEAIGQMSAHEAEWVIAATQRVINALAARQAVAMATFADAVDADLERDRAEREARWEAARAEAVAAGAAEPPRFVVPQPDAASVAGSMLAPVLRVAPRTMVARIHHARWLGAVDRTRAMAWSGTLEPYRWLHIARAAAMVGVDGIDELEARVHDRDLTHLAASRVRQRCLTAVERVVGERDPEASAERRTVTVEPADEAGLTRWSALLPAPASMRMWAAVDQVAADYRAANPGLTVGQARADAFVDLVLANTQGSIECVLVVPTERVDPLVCTSVPSAATGAEFEGELRGIDLVLGGATDLEWRWGVEIERATRVDSHPRLQRSTQGAVWFVPDPVRVPPVGSLLPQQVAAILADPDSAVRLAGVDPGSKAVSRLGETAYRPGRHVARLVRLRDGTCRFPGCAAAARDCQLDHVTPFPHGPTSLDNLQSLCPTHHGFKHHAGWGVSMTPDGVCTWSAPNGRTHVTHPWAVADPAA